MPACRDVERAGRRSRVGARAAGPAKRHVGARVVRNGDVLLAGIVSPSPRRASGTFRPSTRRARTRRCRRSSRPCPVRAVQDLDARGGNAAAVGHVVMTPISVNVTGGGPGSAGMIAVPLALPGVAFASVYVTAAWTVCANACVVLASAVTNSRVSMMPFAGNVDVAVGIAWSLRADSRCLSRRRTSRSTAVMVAATPPFRADGGRRGTCSRLPPARSPVTEIERDHNRGAERCSSGSI